MNIPKVIEELRENAKDLKQGISSLEDTLEARLIPVDQTITSIEKKLDALRLDVRKLEENLNSKLDTIIKMLDEED